MKCILYESYTLQIIIIQTTKYVIVNAGMHKSNNLTVECTFCYSYTSYKYYNCSNK